MSNLTHLIVCFWGKGTSGPSEEEDRIGDLAVILRGFGHNALAQVDGHAGGEKFFCPCVLMGCFNHMSVECVLEEFRKLSWDGFYYAWLMSEDENSNEWSEMVSLKPEKPLEDGELAEQRDYWLRCSPNTIVSEPYVVDDL